MPSTFKTTGAANPGMRAEHGVRGVADPHGVVAADQAVEDRYPRVGDGLQVLAGQVGHEAARTPAGTAIDSSVRPRRQ